MKFTTIIKAINPMTGELSTFVGPNIESISHNMAQDYCNNNGLGYCKVDGILVEEIPVKEGTTNEPDWNNKIDYTYTQN